MTINALEERRCANNNFVAVGDLSAALTAIDNQFQKIHERIEHRDDLACGTIFEKTRISLKTNLERILQPLENEDYNAIFRKQYPVQKDIDEEIKNKNNHYDDDDDDTDIDQQGSNEKEGQNENYSEFDPDELIDHEALSRVTKLRAEIRLASKQLALYRDSVTLKALKLADHQIRVTQSVVKTNPTQSTVAILREEFETVTPPIATQQLADCILHLTEHIHSLDLESPAQLLQETLATVEKAQLEPLSQTELAIQARNHERNTFGNKVFEDPIERLNFFLG